MFVLVLSLWDRDDPAASATVTVVVGATLSMSTVNIESAQDVAAHTVVLGDALELPTEFVKSPPAT